MSAPIALVTRPIPDNGLALLRRGGLDVRLSQPAAQQPVGREALAQALHEASVLVCLLTETIDAELLDGAPRLRGIANYAVGYDNIDVGAASALGIPVSNTPGVITESTADLTWALLLALARRVPQADAYTRAGRYTIWGPRLLLGRDVGPGGRHERKVLGIIGFGRIGQAVARRAVGFDLTILAHDPRHRDRVEAAPGVEWAEVDALWARADFISLHAPASKETHHLIGASELRAMKPTALLINTARGALVDEAALVRALSEGWIAGAGLDVYEHEPALAEGLAELDNVILLPHLGSATHETRELMAEMAAENALAHVRGDRAPHCVNAAVYESDVYRRRRAGS